MSSLNDSFISHFKFIQKREEAIAKREVKKGIRSLTEDEEKEITDAFKEKVKEYKEKGYPLFNIQRFIENYTFKKR